MKRTLLLATLLTAASACFNLDGFMFDFQRRDAYQLPDDDAKASRSLIPVTASDGVRIWALFMRAAVEGACVPAVLYCRGNSEDLQDHYHRVKALRDLGWDVLSFDYRGNGMSEGSPTEDGVFRDGRAALAELRARARGPVVLYGTSFGSAVCTQLAVEQAPAALHLDCPIPGVDQMVRDNSDLPLPGSFMSTWSFNNLEKIGQVRAPVQIFHGEKDDYIRHEYGEEIYRRANDPKEFWLVPGAGHGDIFDAAGFADRLSPWMNRVCR
jgi:fermentation-respiration switch protein FrsA (DUF1100 family)